MIFQEKLSKVLKCYNFLWVQRRHNCSPAASFANCVMTLYLLKAHLETFLSIPITQKCQKFLSCDTPVANERYNFLLIPLDHFVLCCNCLRLKYRQIGNITSAQNWCVRKILLKRKFKWHATIKTISIHIYFSNYSRSQKNFRHFRHFRHFAPCSWMRN